MLRNGFEKLENGMINEGLAMLGGWPTSGVLRRLARAGPEQKLPGGDCSVLLLLGHSPHLWRSQRGFASRRTI